MWAKKCYFFFMLLILKIILTSQITLASGYINYLIYLYLNRNSSTIIELLQGIIGEYSHSSHLWHKKWYTVLFWWFPIIHQFGYSDIRRGDDLKKLLFIQWAAKLIRKLCFEIFDLREFVVIECFCTSSAPNVESLNLS